MGKGNRRLVIRLPADHWVWRVESSVERRAKVREALELYPQLAEVLAEIRQALREIRVGVRPGDLRGKEDGSGSEDRLLSSLDKFLEEL